MNHPFDGVAPEVVVEGTRFVWRPEYACYESECGLVDVFVGPHPLAGDYSVPGTPLFRLDLPREWENFRSHLRNKALGEVAA